MLKFGAIYIIETFFPVHINQTKFNTVSAHRKVVTKNLSMKQLLSLIEKQS